MKNSRFDVKSMGSLLSLVQYGCSSLAKENQPGIPILRMNNLQDDGWDLSSLKYIELGEREFATYRLIPGDILFNRTNSKELVGKCSVFQESGDWVFASYLIRVRTDRGRLLPQFASDFLTADIGRLQIDRISRQIIGMTNINAEEIRELRIPLPAIYPQSLNSRGWWLQWTQLGRNARQSWPRPTRCLKAWMILYWMRWVLRGQSKILEIWPESGVSRVSGYTCGKQV